MSSRSSRWCERATHFYGTTTDGCYASFVRSKVTSLVEIPASLSFIGTPRQMKTSLCIFQVFFFFFFFIIFFFFLIFIILLSSESCFLMCTAAVALRALTFHANIREGERVLVTGASGGKPESIPRVLDQEEAVCVYMCACGVYIYIYMICS